MSLINDALDRAHAEAARRRAAERGEVAPPVAPPPRDRGRFAWWVLGALAAGFALAWVWLRAPLPEPRAAATPELGAPASTSAPLSGASDAENGSSPPAGGADTVALDPPRSAALLEPGPTPAPAAPPDRQPAVAATPPPAVASETADPPRPTASKGSSAASGDDGSSLRLDGIAFSTSAPSAIVNGELVGLGDLVGDLRIVGITRRQVTLSDGERTVVLELP